VGAIAASLEVDSSIAVRHVVNGLQAARYRGEVLETVTIGTAAVGVVNDPAFVDAAVAHAGRFATAIVGTIANHDDLVAELRSADVALIDDANPACTISQAFRVWGEDTCSKMRGDFAAVVSDGRRLWAFRDHLGSSPLFFHVDAKRAFVASEAKQVAAGTGISREPDLDAITSLFFGSERDDREPPCAIAGVERVPRASVTVLAPGAAVRTRRYWDPSALIESSTLDRAEVQDRLVELLRQAVERTVTGNDVVALSGGIDSPVVASFAAPAHLRRSGNPLPALSTLYPHARTVDESRYIEPIVDQLGLAWHTYIPQYRQLDDLQEWADRFDGPAPNVDTPALAEYLARARSLGARTVLFGEFAELLFDLRRHLEGHLVLGGHWIAAGRLLRSSHGRGTTWYRAVRSLLSDLVPLRAGIWYARRHGNAKRSAPDWIDPSYLPGSVHRPYAELPARRRWPEGQLHTALSPSSVSVELSSICASFYGIHLRRPLIDLDLWEFFLSLPAHVKYPDPVRKSIVRRAMRGRVPDVVLDRSDKTVFSEDVLGRANYPGLRKWILDTDFRMKGINYDLVTQRLENENLALKELDTLNHLASVHAFLDLWS